MYANSVNTITEAGQVSSRTQPVRTVSNLTGFFLERIMDSKMCTECKATKPLEDFGRRSDNPSRYRSECKLCSWERRDIRKKQKPDYLIKRRAYNQIRYAKKVGNLIEPEYCEDCGKNAKLEAHHSDYKKELDVRWLCRVCHIAFHHLSYKGEVSSSVGRQWYVACPYK